MTGFGFVVIAAACWFALTGIANAAPLSQAEYHAARDEITNRYVADKSACAAAGHRTDSVCIAEAKAREMVAKAELTVTYSPSTQNRYYARMSRADAAYAIDDAKCGSGPEGARAACRQAASDALAVAKAEARAPQNLPATPISRREPPLQPGKEVMTAKRNAAFASALEKCNTYADATKDTCIKEAKARFGQS
ncbi:MAG: hypothetical protein KIT73_02315 [Burkholderiales bacterium]|nr:hypothetical protein [Burkholderiales bacterium]